MHFPDLPSITNHHSENEDNTPAPSQRLLRPLPRRVQARLSNWYVPIFPPCKLPVLTNYLKPSQEPQLAMPPSPTSSRPSTTPNRLTTAKSCQIRTLEDSRPHISTGNPLAPPPPPPPTRTRTATPNSTARSPSSFLKTGQMYREQAIQPGGPKIAGQRYSARACGTSIPMRI